MVGGAARGTRKARLHCLAFLLLGGGWNASMTIQQAIQFSGIVQVGVDRFLVRVRLHKYRIIRLGILLDGNV